jgi:ubiquitin C-terminal hydrolase
MQNFPCLDLNNQNSSGNLNQKINFNPKSQILSYNFFTQGITYPHKAGLENVGQSCYMNATIECLSNIKSLSNHLIENYGNYNSKTQPLCVSYSSLLYELIFTNKNCIEPKLFKEIIGKLNPLFEGNHSVDAKDFIFFIIETLHRELLPPSNNNNENNEIDFLQQEQNAKDENKMRIEFIKEFNLNRTIISDIFYGINRSIMKCNNCGTKKYSFQTFNLLIFPLKKVKEYKMRQIGRGNLDLNLYDAFSCEQEAERLEGENMIYCNVCRQLSPGVHQQQIYGMPRILIIILNRGKNNQDFNEEFRFEEILDFTNKNLVVNNGSIQKFYLCGIITHLGESGAGSHFIAYCRNKLNDPFTCYNDAVVSQASVADAMAAKISKKGSERKTPYILIYHYMK